MHRFLVVALATMSCVLGNSTAQAGNVEVNVYETGPSGIQQEVASWMQDQNPTPIFYKSDFYTTVPVFDATGLGGDTAVSWYSGTNGQLGGFTNYNEDFNVLAPTSYAFTEAAPTFIPGRYDGVDVKPNFTYLQVYYTITVLPDVMAKPTFKAFSLMSPVLESAIAPVPEPDTWAMMLAGLGMIGLAARRRRSLRATTA